MVGHGGSERRGSACRRVAAALLGLAGLAGCGSRTSMLDLAAYTEGGSGSLGGSSNRAGATGIGGTGNKPGDPGGPNSDEARCKAYCDAYASACPDDATQMSCRESCRIELFNSSGKCRESVLAALACLEPYLRAAGRCEEVSARALLACEAHVQALELCGRPAPQPPEPQPICGGGLSATDDYCEGEWICNDITYMVSCRNVMGSTNCVCVQNGEVAREVGAGPWQPSSCYAGAQACGFTVVR